MCWWDKQLIARTNDAQLILRLYKRYVDDGNVIVDDMQTNTTDEEVIKKVNEIANTIDACIQSTYDYGSKYEDGRVPMLDLKLWIGENEWRENVQITKKNNTMKEGRRKMKRKLRGTIEKNLRVLCSLMLQKIR